MTLPPLVEAGTVVGPPRVIEACLPGSKGAPGLAAFKGALGLLAGCASRRVRAVLSGDGPVPEPWLEAVEKAAACARAKGKEFDPVLRRGSDLPARTSGRWAALGGRALLPFRAERTAALRRTLSGLARAGVEAVVDFPVAPADVSGLAARLKCLESLGTARARFTAAPGAGAGRAMTSLELGLSAWLEALARSRKSSGGLEVVSFWEEEEPDLLSSDLVLTAEGGLAWATAVRQQGLWPEFLQAAAPTQVRGCRSLESLVMEPSARQAWALRVLRPSGRDVWRDSVSLSLRLWGFFQKPFPGWRDGSENKSIRRGLISADLAGQDRFLSSHLPGVSSVFLFLRTGCVNDCVFCKAKPSEPGQSLAEVSARLKAGARVSRRKIALAGNEPLLQPDITEVLRSCRKAGFTGVEVMTSGTLLTGPDAASALRKSGATALALPLYAADADLHDRLTGRKGSFNETVRSVENARKAGLKVFVHANLLKQNLGALSRLEGLVLREWGLPFAILPIRPKSRDSMNLAYEELEPSYKEMQAAGLKVSSMTGFPVCVQRRIQGPAVLDPGQLADSVKLYLLHQTFVKPVSCLKCPETRRCLGTFREHLEAHPDDLPLLAL
ncbi:MAG: radical SAM protein [Elusimicrobiota bacterium]|jgi:pyruvate-formate lyase-activating enzyme